MNLEPISKRSPIPMDRITEPQSHLQRKANGAVFAEIREITDLKPFEYERLYHIFSKYYDGHSKEQFLKDLFEKNHIILLRAKSDRTLQGFSTLLKMTIKTDQGSAIGIFSGDTILEKEYWGDSALGKAFLKYLWLEKIKNLQTPLYWFLISKGYKTYLLMANNFSTHYPRYEMKTPSQFQKLINDFYRQRYPLEFDPMTCWIRPNKNLCRLKEKVADITASERTSPRIAFFEKSNPHWQEGYELACLAEMTLFMPLKYSFKKALKKLKRMLSLKP